MIAIGETHRLLLEAEALLFERFDATSDPTEKRTLRAQIEAIGDLKDRALLDDAAAHAARMNALSDVLTNAIANLRSQPFNGIAGRIELLLAGIGDALGAAAGERRGAPATDASEPAEPAPVVGSATGAAPAAIPSTAQPAMVAPAVPVASAPRPSPESESLAKEYTELFDSCVIRPERARLVAQAAARIVAHAAVYRDAAEAAGGAIPWYFIGIIHALESSFSFSTHLHNGDPLTARTVRVPEGHPRAGAPPFTWKESASDALRLKGFDRAAEWSLPRMLQRFEAYNGFGYRNRGIHSPYLWSFSEHYTRGKFVRDRVFDPEAVSEQCGAAVLLKQLVLDGVVTLDSRDGTLQAEAALGLRAGGLPAPATLPLKHLREELEFPGEVKEGARNLAAKRVQEWCSFHGFPTRIDRDFGSGTADALRAFQASRGLPVTGVADAASWAALTAPMLHAIATPAPGPAGLHAMVLSVARQHLAQKPIEIGGDNRGPWVRLYMEGREGSDQLWCAGFVCFVLDQAARALGKRMPIPRQVGVDALVSDAKGGGRFLNGADLATPAARTSRLPAGSLFVIRHRSNANDWIHTGFVIEAREGSFLTIEGNTNRDGGANGFEVTSRSRGYAMADFVLIA